MIRSENNEIHGLSDDHHVVVVVLLLLLHGVVCLC